MHERGVRRARPDGGGGGRVEKDRPLRSGGFAVLCDKCGYASPFLLPPPSPLPHSALPLRVRAGSVPNGLPGSLARRLDESIRLDGLPTFAPCLFLSRRREDVLFLVVVGQSVDFLFVLRV